jgi:PAS domain S-box-containing protein
VRCNETLLRATGYSQEEVLGKTIFDLYHLDSLAAARQSFAAFQETGELREVERRVVRKDGSTMDVSLNASAVAVPRFGPTGSYGGTSAAAWT